MGDGTSLPRLDTEFATWYHLLTAPAENAEEAAFSWICFVEAAGAAVPMLEGAR